MSARRRDGIGDGTGAMASVLDVEILNAGRGPVEVAEVHAGFLSDDTVSSGRVEVPLAGFTDTPALPSVLGAGDTLAWSVGWQELREEARLRAEGGEQERPSGRVLPAVLARLKLLVSNSRRAVVVVRDGSGGRHEAEIEWEPARG